MRGILITVAAAVTVLVAAEPASDTPATAQGQAIVDETYPVTPQRVNGKSVAADLPGPKECAPSRDRGTERDYIPLSRLKGEQARDPFADGDVATVRLELVNAKRQHFFIYVSAGDDSAVRRYIDDGSACMERFRVKRLPPPLVRAVAFDRVLLHAADAAGISRGTLAALAKSAPPGGPEPSFLDLVATAGGDPSAVLDQAIGSASARLQQLVASGKLDPAKVAALDVADLVSRLAKEPGAPFVYDPASVPRTRAELGAWLRAKPRQRVSIGMTVPPRRGRDVVWFAFDPDINLNQDRNYKAHCERESYVGLRAWKGGASYFFSLAGSLLDSKTSWWWHDTRKSSSKSMSKKHTFDVRVTGKANGSNYSIYGGWLEGGGGGC